MKPIFLNSFLLSSLFIKSGVYTRRDLNMPEKLPCRVGAPHSFYKDCPLTNIGLLQATLVGQALKNSSTEVHHVFCSPSLRCVQTCTNILKGDLTHYIDFKFTQIIF